MKLEDFKEMLEGLTYKGKPCAKVKSYDFRNTAHGPFGLVPQGYVYVSVWIHATDVDTGKPTQIESGHLMAVTEIEDEDKMGHLNYIKHLIIGLEMHEVEETFALNGVQIYSPHGEPPKKIIMQEAA